MTEMPPASAPDEGTHGCSIPCPPAQAIVPERERTLYLQLRQGLIIQLAALENYLGLERSVPPHRRRADAPLTTGEVVE